MRFPKVWAHRGGRRWPQPGPAENSMGAFELCLQHSVHGIEIDVHKCRSGELVVLHGGVHGGDVSHHTDGVGLVRDLTWSELKTLRLCKNVDPGRADERIPLLDEVLELLDGRCMLNIEIKNAPWRYARFADDLIAITRRHKAADWLIYSSFDHGILHQIHRKAPHLKLGMLIDGLIYDIGSYAKTVGFQYWHPYLGELRTDYVRAAHRAGIAINVWTPNTPDEWDLAIKLGVDAIVTDDPVGCREHVNILQQRRNRR